MKDEKLYLAASTSYGIYHWMEMPTDTLKHVRKPNFDDCSLDLMPKPRICIEFDYKFNSKGGWQSGHFEGELGEQPKVRPSGVFPSLEWVGPLDGDQYHVRYYWSKDGRIAATKKNIPDRVWTDKIIAIDFDGTIVSHKYPDVGAPLPYAIDTMKDMQVLGAKLILFTMRSGPTLIDAVEYCRQNGVEFWGVNENPEQSSWTASPKPYANIYIDDSALGCPKQQSFADGKYVDWREIRRLFGFPQL